MTLRGSLVVLALFILAVGAGYAEPPRRTANMVEFASASLTSASGCEELVLALRRETFPDAVETTIQHYFLLDVCTSPPIGTPLAFGEDIRIPNADFTLERARGVARLRTSLPPEVFGLVGHIDLAWNVNLIVNETFAGKGKRTFLSGESENDLTTQMFKQTRDDRTADVVGVAFGYSLTGLGGFGWTTLVATEK